MNGEIKYKVWVKSEAKMYVVRGISFDEDGKLWSVVFDNGKKLEENKEQYCNLEDFEIMQYTGLKDKNGVEIYEGDIVRYKKYHNYGYADKYSVGEVEWGETGDSDGYCHLKHYDWTVDGESLADVADGGCEGFECEVIGNIYMNPELLEEKK